MTTTHAQIRRSLARTNVRVSVMPPAPPPITPLGIHDAPIVIDGISVPPAYVIAQIGGGV